MDKRSMLSRMLPAIFSMVMLAGCTAGVTGTAYMRDGIPVRWQTEIRQLVRIQEQAIWNGDAAAYMQTIDAGDPHYRQEQVHWYADAASFVRGKTYRRSVKEFLQLRSNHEVVALVEQLVADGRDTFRVQVPIRFRRTQEGWKDADLPFLQIEGTRSVAKVTHRRLLPLAAELLRRAEDARQRLSALYGWRPRHPVTLKLYGDKDWFRQSVKLSLPAWAAGWHEDGESIKLLADGRGFLRDEVKRFYHSAVIHEMVHQMLAELTNDNAAYWLHEGLAEHVTALLDTIPENDALPPVEPGSLWSWPELAAVQLERLPAELAEQYYRQARLVVAYLLDCYGDDALRAVFAKLREHPRMPESTAEKQDLLHLRTVQALEDVLHKPFGQLADEWRQWVHAM